MPTSVKAGTNAEQITIVLAVLVIALSIISLVIFVYYQTSNVYYFTMPLAIIIGIYMAYTLYNAENRSIDSSASMTGNRRSRRSRK